MQGLRLPICISSRGSLASTVTAGEVAEAQAPKLRQQLELQIRRGRNCQTTGGRIVRKHCKYRGTRRCCQEGLKTPKTWSATSSTSKTKMPAVRGRGSPTPLKPRPQRRRVCFLKWCVVFEKLPVRHHAPPPKATMLLKNGGQQWTTT